MNDLIRSSVLDERFQEWLDSGIGPMQTCPDGKPAAEFVQLMKSPSARYLYRTAIGKDGSITWSEPMAFSGVYDTAGRALYLTRETLNLLASGEFQLADEAGDFIRKEICRKINRRVEEIIADDRANLPVREVTGEMPRSRIRYYQEHGARHDAIRMIFDGKVPDGRFHSGYGMDCLPENDFLSYIENPDGFIRTKAEAYIKANQELFLQQFLMNDALLAEYRALMQDADSPVHRMKAITDAIHACGAQTVTVTVRKDGQKLTFKAEAYSLTGYQSYYSAYHTQASDRRKFKELFDRNTDYSAGDITRITYGRKIIYEASAGDALSHDA